MINAYNYRLLAGGVPRHSSVAFLFAPKPNATLVRSPETGVAVCDCEGESTADDIRENPGFALGPGDPDVGPMDEKREGVGLTPLPAKPSTEGCGGGKVMKLVESGIWDALALAASFFLLLFFSVLPLDNGGGSKNSEAWGTAL